MSYSSILKELVSSSNLTYKEIADECKKHGTSIDKSYISKLINNKISPPSNEVSHVLEKVFNSESNLLVVESYFEKASEPITNFIAQLREGIITMTLPLFKELNDEQIQLYKKDVYDLPSLHLLNELAKNFQSSNIKVSEDQIGNTTFSIDLKVCDDGLYPPIPNGAKVQVVNCDVYNDGDILAVQTDEDEQIIVRRYFDLSDSQVLLIATNINHKPIVVDSIHLAILGKVVSYKASIE